MFGSNRYAEINAYAKARLAKAPLIAVHRGSGGGSIAENTGKAIKAALAQGADLVEIDVIESTDGEFFVFHNGYEKMHFGLDCDIRTLPSSRLEELNYDWFSNGPIQYGLERLATVFKLFPKTWFNLDRSWWYWRDLLPWLDQYADPSRVLLKSPVADEYLQRLVEHRVKYPYMPMVRSRADIEAVLEYVEINTVGFELLAENTAHEFISTQVIEELHQLGYFVFVNALNLADQVPLFAGFDDETSILVDPNAGWGELVRRGADVIQTDWPGLLRNYLNTGQPTLNSRL